MGWTDARLAALTRWEGLLRAGVRLGQPGCGFVLGRVLRALEYLRWRRARRTLHVSAAGDAAAMGETVLVRGEWHL